MTGTHNLVVVFRGLPKLAHDCALSRIPFWPAFKSSHLLRTGIGVCHSLAHELGLLLFDIGLRIVATLRFTKHGPVSITQMVVRTIWQQRIPLLDQRAFDARGIALSVGAGKGDDSEILQIATQQPFAQSTTGATSSTKFGQMQSPSDMQKFCGSSDVDHATVGNATDTVDQPIRLAIRQAQPYPWISHCVSILQAVVRSAIAPATGRGASLIAENVL